MESLYEYFGFGPSSEHAIFWVLAFLAVIVFVLVVGFIVYVIYSILDWWGSEWQQASGVVIQHQYQAATSSTGFGVGVGSNGTMPIVTSSSSSEEYILFVREIIGSKEGEVYKFEMEMNDYFNHKDGVKVSFMKRIGRISHTPISQKLLN